jgi:CheY-like chemotaxis protein
MKILVVDETRARAAQLAELVRGKRHDAVCCSTSVELLDALQTGGARAVLLDMATWRKGKSINGYFGVARKLADTPIVFYNAPEGFSALPDRARLERDAVLPEAATVETIVESLAGAM